MLKRGMNKIYFTNYSLELARTRIFNSLKSKEPINIFDALELSSGDYLPKSKMENGKHAVYGGGGFTTSTHKDFNVIERTLGIGRVGARCGCCFIIEPKSWVTDNALFVSNLKYDYDYSFLMHYLNHLNLNKFSNQSAQPVISQRGISKCTLPIIDIEEQKKIASILDAIVSGSEFEDTYDLKLVLNIEKNISEVQGELSLQETHLHKLRQAILQEAVHGKLMQQNAADEPADKLLQRIKAEKLKLLKAGKLKKERELPPIAKDEIPLELPKGWVWCRIGEIADIGTGGTPLTSTTEYYNGNIPWITSCATGSPYVSNAEKFITQKAVKETNCKVYPVGTLIVAMYGQGKTRGQVTELLIEAATNQACASIELIIKDKQHKEYIKYFFQKIYLEIRELAAGGAQPNLNLQKIKETFVPLPPLPEQHRIVTKVQQLLQIANQLEKHVAQSQTQAQQLLQAVLKEAFVKKDVLYGENELLTLAAEPYS